MAQTHRHARKHIVRLHIFLSTIVVTMAFFMVVPFWVALSAGIASVSLELFGVAVILLLVCLCMGSYGTRSWLTVALSIALLGAIVPQLAFLQTAAREDAQLSFNPISYATFSGATSLPPTQTVTYKTIGSQSLKLAYYKAANSGENPAVVLLHGGGWRYGDYQEVGAWPQLLTEAGFSVFSVQYRLSNDTYATWRDAPSDVHDAIGYIQQQAATFSIIKGDIALLGQSAGGHLALLEAYRHHNVSSVVSLYAPVDLSLDYQTSRDKSSELDFLGGPPKQYPKRYSAVSPIQYVSSDSPRTLIVQGSRDDLVDTRNATLLESALQEYSVEHHLLLLPLTGHSFENQRGGFASQITTQSVLKFLSR